MSAVEIRGFAPTDAEALEAFWVRCGLRIRPGDDAASLVRFAERNPGLFLLAHESGRIVGSALAGWDGRRGWLYHVGTDPRRRRAGLGRALVSAIETRLRALGCPKLNLMVWEDNDAAMAFWLALATAASRRWNSPRSSKSSSARRARTSGDRSLASIVDRTRKSPAPGRAL